MHGNLIATKRLMAFSLLSSSVGFLCAFIATLGPAWIVIDSGHNKWMLKEGIWLAQLCDVFGNRCKTSVRENILSEVGFGETLSQMSELHWMELKIFTIISVFGGLVTIVVATVIVVRKSKHTISRPVLVVCFIASMSSCFFLLVPVLKISSVSIAWFDGQAWSIWVSSVGVLFQFITSCLIVFAFYQKCRQSFKRITRRTIRRERREIVENYLASQRGSSNDRSGTERGTSNINDQSQLGTSSNNQSQIGTSNMNNQSLLGISHLSNKSLLGTSNKSNQSKLGTRNMSDQFLLGTSNRGNQSEGRHRENSLTWSSFNDPRSYNNSIRSSAGVSSSTVQHLPALNEIMGPSTAYETT